MKYLLYKPSILYKIEALKIAVAIVAAYSIYRLFRVQSGTWIILTVSIIFLGGAAHGYVMQRLNQRLLGVMAGLTFGTFYLLLFTFTTSSMIYLSPVFFFLAFYTYFLSKCNYFYLSFFLSVYLLLIFSIQTPYDVNWNLANTTFSRLFCTLVGAVILLLTNLILFHKFTLPKNTTAPLLENFVKNCKYIIISLNNNFINNRTITGLNCQKLSLLESEADELKNISSAGRYELNFIESYEEKYNKILNEIKCILKIAKNLTYINNHCSIRSDMSINIVKHINGVLDKNDLDTNASKKYLKYYLENCNGISEESEEYLYLKHTHRVVWHLCKLDRVVRDISFNNSN